MEALPLVSVIIPAYNSSAYIADAIRSVLAQDYDNKEIIVIDDGSTDSTPEILKSFGDKTTVLTQANAGPGAARNRGLKHAAGTYIAFLDSDDVWVFRKLRLQIDYLQDNREIGAVYSNWLLWHADKEGQFVPPFVASVEKPAKLVQEDSGWIYSRLLFECRLLTSSVVLRRSLLERVGLFDETLRRGQDYDYWLRTSRLSQIHKLDLDLVLYRIHQNNIAVKYPNQNYELMIVKKNVSRWGLTGPDGRSVSQKHLERHLGELCFSFGYWHAKRGGFRIARRAFWESLKYQPFNLRGWVYLWLTAVRGLIAAA
jgi:glycosyltransferase involved in cell wall biosynthesis